MGPDGTNVLDIGSEQSKSVLRIVAGLLVSAQGEIHDTVNEVFV